MSVLDDDAREMSRFLRAGAFDHEARPAGPHPAGSRAARARGAGRTRRSSWWGRASTSRLWDPGAPRRPLRGAATRGGVRPCQAPCRSKLRRPARRPRARPRWTRSSGMLAPAAGRDARRLHLRRRRPRAPARAALGRGRPLRGHRPRPRGRGSGSPTSPSDVACETRFIRANFADALPRAGRRGRARRRDPDGPRHLLDAGRPARARLLVLAPGAARHADGPRPARAPRPTWSPSAARTSWPARSARTARSATRGPSPGPSCAAAPGAPSPPPGDLVEVDRAARPDAGAVRRRPPGQAGLPGAAHRGQRRARQPGARPRRRPSSCSRPAAAWR